MVFIVEVSKTNVCEVQIFVVVEKDKYSRNLKDWVVHSFDGKD